GDSVEVLGAHMTPDDLAEHARTNAYEVMTSLGRRYARVYVDQPEPQPEPEPAERPA
ncbi:MAG: alanine racemase C-terminal domain-containing protein, partial [Enhydrobacter sp.]